MTVANNENEMQQVEHIAAALGFTRVRCFLVSCLLRCFIDLIDLIDVSRVGWVYLLSYAGADEKVDRAPVPTHGSRGVPGG
mgnify:CR=1 FL=1